MPRVGWTSSVQTTLAGGSPTRLDYWYCVCSYCGLRWHALGSALLPLIPGSDVILAPSSIGFLKMNAVICLFPKSCPVLLHVGLWFSCPRFLARHCSMYMSLECAVGCMATVLASQQVKCQDNHPWHLWVLIDPAVLPWAALTPISHLWSVVADECFIISVATQPCYTFSTRAYTVYCSVPGKQLPKWLYVIESVQLHQLPTEQLWLQVSYNNRRQASKVAMTMLTKHVVDYVYTHVCVISGLAPHPHGPGLH